MSFAFVDNTTGIDHATRRRIRSHVAIGRNAGKSLARPAKKSERAPMSTANLARIPDMVWDAYELKRSQKTTPEIERQVGDGLCFPGNLDPASRHLARRVFSFMTGPRHAPELNSSLDSSGTNTSISVQYMLWDEAYFHCAVATSITIINTMVTKQENTTEVLRHLSHTFRLINERLAGADTVSDATIATITGMAQFERQQGQFDRGLIHVHGLQRMAQLRGGISQLTKHNPGLTQKVFRADLEYALQLGSETLFSPEDVEGCSIALGRRNSSREEGEPKDLTENNIGLLSQLPDNLQLLFVDMKDFARILNDSSAGHRPKMDGYELHDTLLFLGYRLLSVSPLGNSQLTSPLDRLVHLGLTTFLVAFLRGLDRRIAGNTLLYNLVRSVAHEDFGADQDNQKALLWMLLVGEASIFTKFDDTWLVPKLMSISLTLSLRTWEDVAQMLAKFSWVNDMHNGAAQDVWFRSLSSTSSQIP